MTYLDSQYNQYFQRDVVPVNDSQETSSYDFDSNYKGLSAGQIGGGAMQSINGKITLDLENEALIISDGVSERGRFGRLPDGSYGILLKDINGNIILQMSGTSNFIKSPDGSMELNFDNTQFLIRDEGGLVKVFLGKQVGGFN